ncbi:MAG: helix-turn-helix transcriptional regulator [Ilumatobacteraceae bacterium]
MNNCAIASELVHPAVAAIALAATGSAPFDDASDAAVDRATQEALLRRLCDEAGPAAVLLAGRHLDAVATEPILLALLNSETVDVVVDKLDRLNRFLHSTHRHRVIESGEHQIEIEHRSTTGEPPTAAESLFVCGIYLELFARIGCRDLTCAFPDAPTSDRIVYRSGLAHDVPATDTGRWRISWSGIDARRPLAGLDDLLLRTLPPDLTASPTASAVDDVVATDLARGWRLGDVAAAMTMSPRTLQRRLRDEGTTLSDTVRTTRIEAAQRLLRDPDRSITDIGYVTGFADTAHFSRTFTRACGQTPTVWRRTAV